MEFVCTERRKQKIAYEGYIYTFQKNLANNIRSMNVNYDKEASL